MPHIMFRGQQVEIVTSIDDLDLDAAEIVEDEIGIDLRDINELPRVRMFKVFALISVRKVFPDVTMADVGRINLGELSAALAQTAAAVPDDAPDAEGGEVLSPTNAGSEA